jgi:hypothetical protein
MSIRKHVQELRRLLEADIRAPFGFRTKTAEVVFMAAADLILEFPQDNAAAILQRAVTRAEIPQWDLTPEDFRLLEMAIEWMQNGPPAVLSKTGGVPHYPRLENMGIRTAVKQLREFLAHPVAFGTSGIFSGGYGMPYPAVGQVAFGKYTADKDYDPDPYLMYPKKPIEPPGKDRERRRNKWRPFRKALKRRET